MALSISLFSLWRKCFDSKWEWLAHISCLRTWRGEGRTTLVCRSIPFNDSSSVASPWPYPGPEREREGKPLGNFDNFSYENSRQLYHRQRTPWLAHGVKTIARRWNLLFFRKNGKIPKSNFNRCVLAEFIIIAFQTKKKPLPQIC